MDIIKLKNQRSKREWTTFDATMIAEGVMEASIDELMEAWSILIETKLAFSLQGSFGRGANELLEQKLIDSTGVIDWNRVSILLTYSKYKSDEETT